MATTKQKKVAQLIVENAKLDKPLNAGQMLEKVGYSPHLAKQPGRVVDSEGVREALAELGFTESNAKGVVAEILLNPDAKDTDRLKAAEHVFKVQGSYAAEKSVNLNVDLSERTPLDNELEAIRREYESALRKRLYGEDAQ